LDCPSIRSKRLTAKQIVNPKFNQKTKENLQSNKPAEEIMGNETDSTALLDTIRQLIEESRQQVAVAVNAAITALYWQVGKRIREEVLQERRADYGKQIVSTLAAQLKAEYGSGWSEKQLRHCLRFAEIFHEETIVSTLWRQLSWSHMKEILYMEDAVKRDFYIEMCKLEKWSVRTFRERIQSMLYERTAISKKPDLTILNDLSKLKNQKQLSPDLIFRDPYILDFLGLKDTYSEKDLETAIVAELQRFITELGNDFAFLARQKRISIDNLKIPRFSNR
jgi:predicted nuclease of restriction endonuclease-like (RecB) superfamily